MKRLPLQWPVLLFGLVWLAVAVSPVAAHALLVRSTPADGASLDASPGRVTAWFSQELDEDFSTMQVFNSQEQQVDLGDGGVDLTDPDHTSMQVSLPDSLPSGVYTVHWSAVSAEDGDPSEGRFSFGIAVAVEAERPAAPAVRPPAWLVWPGLAVLVAALGTAFWLRRRSG
ncbi:MAG: hypothetical protein D6784_13045 [Chloroflexi bacterium]|nr:MAG: hypothetical protein D6784_13045 [Chloroflexota bacterium]